MRMVKFTEQDANEFYTLTGNPPADPEIIKHITSDIIVGMEVVGFKAIERLQELIGPSNPEIAKKNNPTSIRALYAQNELKNAVHCSETSNNKLVTSGQAELDFFFGSKERFERTAFLNSCSCLIIKPHIIQSCKFGKVLDRILAEGFEISAMELIYLNKSNAEEFFEVYRGVLPEYIPLLEHITNGPVVVLEARQEKAVLALRQLVGPHDPQLAKLLRPNTIRSEFGIDRVKNAVHCTDLEEDGGLEVF